MKRIRVLSITMAFLLIFFRFNHTTYAQSSNCISPLESWNHYKQMGCVEYTVVYPFMDNRGDIFLDERTDYRNGFTAVIFSNNVGSFPTNPVSMYGYKDIQVTGYIEEFQGHPEIKVSDPSQIQIVSTNSISSSDSSPTPSSVPSSSNDFNWTPVIILGLVAYAGWGLYSYLQQKNK